MIREAQYDDIPRLCELMEQLGTSLPTRQQIERKFDYILDNDDYFVIVDEKNLSKLLGRKFPSILVGTATVYFEQRFSTTKNVAAHIENVVVDEDFRGLGIGSKLVQQAVNFAKGSGAYKIVLNCDRDKVEFYQKFGFKEHDVGMRIDLC